MAHRVVRLGAIAYKRADGADVFGYFGAEVDVHADDLGRFDAINPADAPEPDLEDASADEEPSEDAPEPTSEDAPVPTRRRR